MVLYQYKRNNYKYREKIYILFWEEQDKKTGIEFKNSELPSNFKYIKKNHILYIEPCTNTNTI